MSPASPILQESHPIDPLPKSSLNEKEVKRKKFVPWEPYKAAPAPDRKGERPSDADKTLIPYKMNGELEIAQSSLPIDTRIPLVDTRRKRVEMERKEENERIEQLEKERADALEQVRIEQQLNAELKKLLVATIDDDLQCHVNSLTEDKVRLAHTLNDYATKVKSDGEEVEALRIERDVWKCKFLAMSIRADELTNRNEALLGLLRYGQNLVSDLSHSTSAVPVSLTDRANSFTHFNLQPLYERSPCEDKYTREGPKYHNLTISCCKNCAGREIYLL